MTVEHYWWEEIMTLISLPVYAITIGLELILSHFMKRELYSTKDTINNFLMTFLNLGIDTIMRLFFIGVMAYFFQYSIINWQKTDAMGFVYWISVIVLTDLAYWFVHYLGHMVRLFWAVHIVHHSSEKYNITVGFRSSVFEPLYRCFFFFPLAFLGFNAADVMLAFSIQQLYGSLVHTKLIRKMGFWEILFVTPSHHRVHHASNVRYLDKNMGMIFIFWDKLFGTFEKEDDSYQKIKFGLTKNLETYNPLTVLFIEWKAILSDVKSAPGFANKLMYVFGPPGWSHDGSRKTSKQMQLAENAATKETKLD